MYQGGEAVTYVVEESIWKMLFKTARMYWPFIHSIPTDRVVQT